MVDIAQIQNVLFEPEEMRGIVWLDQTIKKNKTKDDRGDQVEE